MPEFTPSWTAFTPLSAKSLNVACYTADGTINQATGILFFGQRPLTIQSYGFLRPSTANVPTSPTGLRSSISGTSLTIGEALGQTVYDASGFYGKSSTNPGGISGYTFTPAVPGSAGTFPTAGGWMWLYHSVPVTTPSSGEMLGADMNSSFTTFIEAGARLSFVPSRGGSSFFLDLFNTTPIAPATVPTVYTPALLAVDSASADWTISEAGNDSSGRVPRYMAWWAAITTPNYVTSLPVPGTMSTWTPSSAVTSSALNTEVVDAFNFLSNPPVMRVAYESSQSISTSTATLISFGSTAPTVDNYSGWSTSTNEYTIQRAGLYLVHGISCWGANSSETRITGVAINGTIYWGPSYMGGPESVISSKTQVFSLNAGDVISLYGYQRSGSTLDLSSADFTRLTLSWLAPQGTPATLWNPPDLAYRWRAGSPPGMLPYLFQQHLTNDIGIITNPPYFMGYQTVAQSGLAQDAWSTVTLDTVGGIVHADGGDNYSGWNATSFWYVSQRAGWYLVVSEVIGTSASVTATLTGGIAVSSSGGAIPNTSPDWGTQMTASLYSNSPPGATSLGIYYLLPGEYIYPQIQAQDYGTTYGTEVGTRSGGTFASHMEVIWISE